jgi:hypothetical protein
VLVLLATIALGWAQAALAAVLVVRRTSSIVLTAGKTLIEGVAPDTIHQDPTAELREEKPG